MLNPTPFKRVLFFVFADIVLSLSSLFLAYSLRFNFDTIEARHLSNFFTVFGVLVSFKIVAFWFFKLYQISWRYVSLSELKRLFAAHVTAYGLFWAAYLLFPCLLSPFPRSVPFIDFFLSLIFLGGVRIAKRIALEGADRSRSIPTLLVGVTPVAVGLLKGDRVHRIVAIVDDDTEQHEAYVSDIKIEPIENIVSLANKKKIQKAIIAKPFDQAKLNNIVGLLEDAHIHDIGVMSIEAGGKQVRPLSLEELLARKPKDLDEEAIEAFVKHKRVLITGGGGSIGGELARLCVRYGARKVVVVDHSEYNLYRISEELSQIEGYLVDVTDKEALEEVFVALKPEIVLHAAAYKHVHLCEHNAVACIKNNILGTIHTVDLSIKYGARKTVVISTDKAVRPTSVMGASKRVAELYAQNVPSQNTEVVAVRFGNVLGSSGSVIPKFKAQIEAGGPVTVTHPEMTRYFMLISEACRLVLQAGAIAKGGEIFILDMGEPVKIDDLARRMIRWYGKEGEVKIVYTGLRAGEKLYEELLLEGKEQATKYASIFVANPTPYPISQLLHDIALLLDSKEPLKHLKRIVAEFQPSEV